jgi:hypothetical protein
VIGRRGLGTAWLVAVALLSATICMADDEVLEAQKRFDEYLRTFFIEKLSENDLNIIEDGRLMAMIYGCALGQQLNHVGDDSNRHRLWLAIEKQVYRDLENFVRSRARGVTPTEEEQALKDELFDIAREATLGKLDGEVERLIGVSPSESPSIFASEEDEITVETLAGDWKFMRGHYLRYMSPELSRDITLSASVTDTGAACYQLKPSEAQMSCWLLKNGAIEFYDVNGTLTYRFEKTNFKMSVEVWHGVRYFRGEIYEEMNEPVDYYLVRRRD